MLMRGVCLIVSVLTACLNVRADVQGAPLRQFGLGDVQELAVSADRQRMASGGQAGAFLWNYGSGELVVRLETGGARIAAMAFSPDGSVLVTGGNDGSVRAFNGQSGAAVKEFVGHDGEIVDIKFAPDGRTFVSTSGDNSARIWSVEKGEQEKAFFSRGTYINAAAFSVDGKTLVTADGFLTNSVKFWDIATEQQIGFLAKTNWTINALGMTSAGELVTAGDDRSVVLWNMQTRERIRSLTAEIGNGIFISRFWTGASNRVTAVLNTGRVIVWNAETGAVVKDAAGEPIIAAADVIGANEMVVADLDYVLRAKSMATGETLQSFAGHMSSSSGAVSISPDGKYIASSGTESATRLWNRRTGELVRTFVGHPAGSMAAVFTADSARILTTYGLPTPAVRLWNVESGALERSFTWAGSWPMSVALSKSGALVAAGAQDGRVRIFDFASGALAQTLINAGWVRSVAFAPNAPLLIAGCSDSSARLWNYETGQLLHTFSAEAGSVRSVAFSPNGDTVAVAWDEGLLRLFNPLTVEMRREIVGQSFLSQVSFSPDGQYLAAAEGWPFFTASIWDARSGELVRSLTGHLWEVGAVAFSADGASVVTASEILRLWDVSDLAARISRKAVGGGMELRWSLGSLQRAPQVNGPWENVPNATSPHTASTGTGAEFYRVLTPANP